VGEQLAQALGGNGTAAVLEGCGGIDSRTSSVSSATRRHEIGGVSGAELVDQCPLGGRDRTQLVVIAHEAGLV
jgi:hypothetical protein